MVAYFFFNGRIFTDIFRIYLLLSDLNAGAFDLTEPVTLIVTTFFFSVLCVVHGGLDLFFAKILVKIMAEIATKGMGIFLLFVAGVFIN